MMGGTSSSSSNMSAPISSINHCVPTKPEKVKDSLADFEFVEQLIIEQQQSEDKSKHSVKRYDPKYRALTEAFRQMEEEDQSNRSKSNYNVNQGQSQHWGGD